MDTKPRNYRFRAECANDVIALLAVMGGQHIISIVIEKYECFPDVDVELRTLLTLRQLQDAMEAVPDGHVMTETVNYKEKYTGDR